MDLKCLPHMHETMGSIISTTHKGLKYELGLKTISGALLGQNPKSCGGRLSYSRAHPFNTTCSALVLQNQRVTLHRQLSL